MSRLHGVSVFVAARVEGEAAAAASGARFAVEGPAAVFGPGRGNTPTGTAANAPRFREFIVAVLVEL